MPRRSNDFQRLMLRIYEQLAPTGATVTESALLRERGSGAQREVDILLEHCVADTQIAIAVECRDHARVSDIAWIDELIGKYRDLRVDRVVAVASKGFTAAASEKATAARIDCRSLQDAIEADWSAELIKVGMGLVTLVLTPKTFSLRTEPPWTDASPPVWVVLADGRRMGMQAFCEAATTALRPRIADHFFREVALPGRPVAELGGTLDQTFEVTAEGVIVEAASGSTRKLTSASFRIVTTARLDPVPVERQRFGSAAITTGLFSIPEGGQEFKVVAVQAEGKPVAKPIVLPVFDLGAPQGSDPAS